MNYYAADQIQKQYFSSFYNEQTGWLAGWKSKDGELHDYAFLFVNGIAIIYGLVPQQYVIPILERLEEKRKKVGYEFFHLGLPGNLIPIRKADYVLNVLGSPNREDGFDSFGNYENGGATMSQAYFYLRALGMSGFPIAEKIGEEVLEAFVTGQAFGGLHKGNDWHFWDGRSNGYEGLLSDQFYVLLAIAQNKNLVQDIPLIW